FSRSQGQHRQCLPMEQTPALSGHLTINPGRNPALIMRAKWFMRMMRQTLLTNCGIARRLRVTGIVPEEQSNSPFRLLQTAKSMSAGKARLPDTGFFQIKEPRAEGLSDYIPS